MLALDPVQGVYPESRRAIAICDSLCEPAQGKVDALTEIRDVRAKQTIFFEGDGCDHLYEVTEGVVCLYKLTVDGRRQIVGFAYPGEMLGTGFNTRHAYTAEAISNSQLRRYPRAKLEAIMEELPGLGRRLLEMTASALRLAQDQMLLLGRKTATEKLATFLLRLSQRQEQQGEDPAELYLPMTRSDIGDYLGLTTETVSRGFSRFRDMGLIDLDHPHHVVLHDISEFMDLAEGDEPVYRA